MQRWRYREDGSPEKLLCAQSLAQNTMILIISDNNWLFSKQRKTKGKADIEFYPGTAVTQDFKSEPNNPL